MAAGSTIKVRTAISDGVCIVRAFIRHPMETGNRKDAETGALIPVHHIIEFVCEHNGKPVMRCYWGTGIARNPYVSFRIAGASAGETLTLRWVDNRGETDSLQVSIA
jgi:sulfur-oxidizing protein SoxZ